MAVTDACETAQVRAAAKPVDRKPVPAPPDETYPAPADPRSSGASSPARPELTSVSSR